MERSGHGQFEIEFSLVPILAEEIYGKSQATVCSRGDLKQKILE